MTISALLVLKHKRSVDFQGSALGDVLEWNRAATPGIHTGRPRRRFAHIRERADHKHDEDDREHRNRSAPVTLFTGSRDKWKCKQEADQNGGRNEKNENFHPVRKQRQGREDGKEIEVGPRVRIDQRRVRNAHRTLGTEEKRASQNGNDRESREEQVLTDRMRNKRHALFPEDLRV